MRNVWTVATNTFREAVRDRVLYNLVFFALLMMGAAILVGQISIGIEQSVIVSLGLTAISVIGIFIAVFIGVGLVSKEMDKRTLYALLAKPVERWEFLAGEIRRAGDDAGREHGGDGGWIVRGAVDGEASAGKKRLVRAGGGVPDPAETGVDCGAGDAVFVLHHAVSGNSVHGGHLYRGRVRGGFADHAGDGPDSGNHEIF